MSTPTRLLFVAAVAASVLLAACGGSDSDTDGFDAGDATATTRGEPTTTTTTAAPPTTTTTSPETTLPPLPPSDYAGFVAQPTACEALAPAQIAPMVFSGPEDQGLDPAVPLQAVIATSCGDIAIELDPGIAPETVNSFVFLARAGYFDGTVSHRILPGFVLQAGDPTATGRDGPGYTIPDELPAAGFLYEKGVLAMANSGPDTSGSQFFIMFADAGLPPNYSVFGRVTEGFDTLERIAAIPLGPNAFGEVSVPLQTLYIEQISISE
ncbi:MAG: peptidylprolyl isomerase [Acidimicrobiia bacterium]|nr:peptidylprolyl isomerase [Acidimicrobiia bacterium]